MAVGPSSSSIQNVSDLVHAYKASSIKHKLIDEDDYIQEPKRSGYRSHHLIYEYLSDRSDKHNGRKVEVQIRTKLQHAWATAVETVGTFTKQALKSSVGARDWLRFFALMGTVFALKEGTPPVQDTPNNEGELLREVREYESRLQVAQRLYSYGNALKAMESQLKTMSRPHFYSLALDPTAGTVTVKGYKFSEIEDALKEYTMIERDVRSRPGGEAVLVSVDSVASLRSAYPNYFLDTEMFRKELKAALNPT